MRGKFMRHPIWLRAKAFYRGDWKSSMVFLSYSKYNSKDGTHEKKSLLYACHILFSGYGFFSSIATLYRQSAGLSIFQITMIESISLVLSFVFEIPSAMCFGGFLCIFGVILYLRDLKTENSYHTNWIQRRDDVRCLPFQLLHRWFFGSICVIT